MIKRSRRAAHAMKHRRTHCRRSTARPKSPIWNVPAASRKMLPSFMSCARRPPAFLGLGLGPWASAAAPMFSLPQHRTKTWIRHRVSRAACRRQWQTAGGERAPRAGAHQVQHVVRVQEVQAGRDLAQRAPAQRLRHGRAAPAGPRARLTQPAHQARARHGSTADASMRACAGHQYNRIPFLTAPGALAASKHKLPCSTKRGACGLSWNRCASCAHGPATWCRQMHAARQRGRLRRAVRPRAAATPGCRSRRAPSAGRTRGAAATRGSSARCAGAPAAPRPPGSRAGTCARAPPAR